MRNLCQLEELGLTCLGCCGHDFKSMKEVMKAIDKNTSEFQDFTENPKGFRDRHPCNIVRVAGVCYNVVWRDKGRTKVFCPLHPEAAGKPDLRQGHCRPEHLCRTSLKFNSWSDKRQQEYMEFLKSKNLNWYEYSIKTDNGKLLEEFERS